MYKRAWLCSRVFPETLFSRSFRQANSKTVNASGFFPKFSKPILNTAKKNWARAQKGRVEQAHQSKNCKQQNAFKKALRTLFQQNAAIAVLRAEP